MNCTKCFSLKIINVSQLSKSSRPHHVVLGLNTIVIATLKMDALGYSERWYRLPDYMM
jgi:hypothetical protein